MRGLVTHYHGNLQQRDKMREDVASTLVDSSSSNAPPCL